MRKSLLALPAAIAAVLTLGAGAAAQASTASAHPANVVGGLYDTDGTAGYYTTSFANTYTQVNGSFTVNLENIGNTGGVGIQLCDSTSGHVAQLGIIQVSPGTWVAVADRGFLANINPTGDGDPCNGSPLLFGTAFPLIQLGPVGVGTTVQAQIKRVHGGLLFSIADGPTVNYNYFIPSFKFPPFNEAAAGTTFDLTTVSAPADLDLVDFSNVTATNDSGITHGFAYWNAVSVSSSADGIPPPLLTVSTLNPATFTRTWHPGHRYYYGSKGNRHYRWIKGYWTSSGGGPSSFSVLGGTPVGP
jgi:hypothetical protein